MEVSATAALAPSYDGQFEPKVKSFAAEGQAQLTIQADRLNALSDQLTLRANEFEKADLETLPGLANLGQLLKDWVAQLSLIDGALGNWGRQSQGVSVLPYPSHPTPDPGSGPFDSIKPALADYAFENLLLAGALQWELVQDRPDAARNMRHYLEGSGEPLEVDVNQLLQDEFAFQLASEHSRQEFLQGVESRILAGYRGKPMAFGEVSPWRAAPYSQTENSYYAMGGFSYAYSAEVNVTPPLTPGESPTVAVSYQMHVWDYYNWDKGKFVTIPRPTLPGSDEPISIPIPAEYEAHISELGDAWVVQDTALARLHLTGLAQEYEITGVTETSTLYYTLDTQAAKLEPSTIQSEGPPPGR